VLIIGRAQHASFSASSAILFKSAAYSRLARQEQPSVPEGAFLIVGHSAPACRSAAVTCNWYWPLSLIPKPRVNCGTVPNKKTPKVVSLFT